MTTGDTFAAFCTFAGLAARQVGICSSSIIPSSLTQAPYSLGAIIDDLLQVPESDEINKQFRVVSDYAHCTAISGATFLAPVLIGGRTVNRRLREFLEPLLIAQARLQRLALD
jgi:hypothetical protein